jgi:hypothetical protein
LDQVIGSGVDYLGRLIVWLFSRYIPSWF